MGCCCLFFFKQKTAYEMRISDWSSDVCSSDLDGQDRTAFADAAVVGIGGAAQAGENAVAFVLRAEGKIGAAHGAHQHMHEIAHAGALDAERSLLAAGLEDLHGAVIVDGVIGWPQEPAAQTLEQRRGLFPRAG